MDYIKISDEEIKQHISPSFIIGKGGNGTVYKILNAKYVFKKIDLRFKRDGKELYNPNEEKKYMRFRDEILVVVKNQNSAPGILPIFQHSNLPEKITKDALLYYVMPYAEPLNKISFNSLEEMVKCFHDLFNSLSALHTLEIAHRDIKPSNIYKYNSEYLFGDFGLVHYPLKKEISKDEKRIGPWATIAPEMERQPFDANPFPADVYSLAKTFWIILTGNQMSFEGQYNYLDDSISLNKHISSEHDNRHLYLGIIHELLRRCTSNMPEERPKANDVAEQLAIWLSGDSAQLCRAEWELLLREIVSSRPKKIIWEDPKEIAKILNMVGKTYGLNHTFLSSGGGLDLHGAKHYSNDKIELDFDSIFIVQPKLLQLNLYEDTQWNHFYFETNDITFSNNGYGNPYSGQSSDEYSQFNEDTYAERWRINYQEFNGMKTPEEARIVTINHHGNFAIFPKISFYNNQLDCIRFGNGKEEYLLDPYDKLHDKFKTADDFALFIEKLIRRSDGHISFSYSFMQKYGSNVTIKPYDQVHHEKVKEFCQFLELQDFRNLFEENDSTSSVNGELNFEFLVLIDSLTLYFLNVKYSFIKKKTDFNLTDLLYNPFLEKPSDTEAFFVQGFEKAKQKLKVLKDEVSNIKNRIYGSIEVDFYIRSRRTSKLKILEILDETNVHQVLSKGNDNVGGNLVLGADGELIMVSREEFSREICPYSALLYQFYPHMNILGPKSGNRLDEFIKNNYNDFLAITLEHLETGRFVEYFDDTAYHTIGELKKLIISSNEKYSKPDEQETSIRN